MTKKQIAEIAAIVLREMRKEEQATTDQMQGGGEMVDAVEAVAKTGVEKKAKPRKAKPRKKKAKASGKFCADLKTYKVNSVKMDEFQHRCWHGLMSLINGYELFLSDTGKTIPALVTRPQVTAKEVVAAIGEDPMHKGLQWHANKALNYFEAECLIVLQRIDRVTGTGSKQRVFKGLRTKVSIGPAGA